MSYEQITGQTHKAKIGNESFVNAEKFKYLEITKTASN
jgi:hypothetical protein